MKKKQRLKGQRAKRAMQEERRASGFEGFLDRIDDVAEKNINADLKHTQMVNSARWNRFMLIRYLDAGLFFVDLYWAVMAISMGAPLAALVPVLDFACALVVIIEMFRVMSQGVEYLVWSHRAMIGSAALTGVVLAVTLAVGVEVFFPFFAMVEPAAVVCLAMLAVKLLIIHRIVLVRDRRDKRYALYEQRLEYANDSKRG